MSPTDRRGHGHRPPDPDGDTRQHPADPDSGAADHPEGSPAGPTHLGGPDQHLGLSVANKSVQFPAPVMTPSDAQGGNSGPLVFRKSIRTDASAAPTSATPTAVSPAQSSYAAVVTSGETPTPGPRCQPRSADDESPGSDTCSYRP